MKKLLRFSIFAILLLFTTFVHSGPVHAADYSDSLLMDDQVFDNVGTMSESQIQSFLVSKGPCLANYYDVDPNWDGTQWTYSGSVLASHIIYKAAQQWGLNPQVIISTLQKEESLITGTSCDSWRYASAMGYGCPDSGGCNAKYAGFTRQVLWGSWQLKFNKERSYGNTAWDGDGSITYVGYMTAGDRKRCDACQTFTYDGYATIDNTSVYMSNGTTASLYTYTPHLNQSFPGIFETWFGPTIVPTYSWQLVSQTYSIGSPSINSTGKEVLTVVAKNTGSATWSNTGSNPVKLGTAGPNDRSSSFYDPSWYESNRPALMSESSVAPGQTGTFTFTVQAPAAGTYQERFNLVAEHLTWMNDPGMYYYFNVSPASYSSQFVSETLPSTLQSGSSSPGTVTYKNTSNVSWYKTGSAIPKMGVYGHDSIYADPSWESPSRAAVMNESSVDPGSNATFTFPLKAPAYAGSYSDSFQPVIEGWSWVQPSFTKNMTVTGTYQGTISPSSSSFTIAAGETKDIPVSFTNTGTATWSNTGSYPMKLGLGNPFGKTSSLLQDTSWLSANRAALLNEASVAQGQTGTFNLRIKAPTTTGIYAETFDPVAEGLTWINSPVAVLVNVVPATYSWQLLGQAYSNGSVNMSPGQTGITLTVSAKNTGSATWHKASGFPIKLATTGPQYRTSVFNDGTWPSAYRAALLDQDTVAPGDTGTFTFTIKVPGAGGAYQEHFSLVAEGLTWLNDPGMYFYINVQTQYSWQIISQSYSLGSVNIAQGQSENLTVVAKNTGTSTWYNSGDFPVRLATTNPKNRTSAFATNAWINSSRPGTMSESSVPPGSNATFTFPITAPPSPGIKNEYFSLITEGIAWMNDPGMYFYLNVQ